MAWLKLIETPLVFIDTETSGLDPAFADVIEFAGIRVEPDGQVTVLEMKIHPERPHLASEEAYAINGYSPLNWSKAITMTEALPKILQFVRGGLIVGFNPKFDTGMIQATMRRHGMDPTKFPGRTIDVMTMAFMLLAPRGLEKLNLNAVCDAMGISNQGAHGALVDVKRTAEVFFELWKDVWGGQVTTWKPNFATAKVFHS